MSSNSRSDDSFVCPFVFTIVFGYLMVLLIGFIDTNNYHRIFRVESFGSLNSLTINHSQFTTEFNISVFVYNPTDFSRVYYDAVFVEVFYGGEGLVLNKTSLPSFTTNRKSASVIKMILSVNRSDDFGGVATGISRSRKDGMVEFGLVLKALFKIKNYVYHSGWSSLKVVCHPLRFAVSPNNYNTTTHGILLKGLTCNPVY
jgi:hypothetical protein